MIPLRNLLAICVIAALGGCLTTGADMTADKKADQQAQTKQAAKSAAHYYPDAEYMTAEGSGQSEAEAKDRALAELGRIFEAKVVSETSDTMSSVYQQKGASKGTEAFTQEVREKVRVTSKMAFEGVQTKDVWFVEADRLHHALAVLNRADARASWGGKVKELDDRASAELAAIDKLKSRFARFRALAAIEGFWLDRAVFASRLRVIGAQTTPPPYDMAQILKDRAAVKSEVTLFIEATGDEADIMRDALAAQLTASGFRIAAARASADILVTSTVTARPLDINNPGWKFTRAEATTTLRDIGTGEDVATVTKAVRTSHVDAKESARKSVRKVASDISMELIELFK